LSLFSLAATALLAVPCEAASKLVENLHKAQSRTDAPERFEYYDRAVKAWEPSDGSALLGQARYGRGQALVDLWRFDQAEPDLAAALETDPANARAYLARGKSRLRLGRYKDAVQDLSEYAGRNPSDVEGLALLAQAQLKSGRAEAALATCRAAQQASPEDARGWLCEGRVWMERREWLRADAALTASDEKAAHRLSDALLDRAVCRVALTRREAALGDYTAAIALDEPRLVDHRRRGSPQPEQDERRQIHARSFYGRGRVLEILARPGEALPDYERACGLGHDQACDRAASLGAAPKEPPPPAKRRKAPAPSGDPGTRIYGG
jgi:tetratricopeptide (TPR) repeat protein